MRLSSIRFLGMLALFTFLARNDAVAQQLGSKVYWMATTKVPIGKLAEYHTFAENELLPLQTKHGYHFVAAWQTIVGDIEEAIVVAEFENMAAYHEARVSLLGSEEWKTVGAKFNELAKGIESRFLSPTAYSKMK